MALVDASTSWKGLSTAQRLSWKTLGAQLVRIDSLGQSYTLTGLQAFTSQYRTARRIGQTPLTTAPAVPSTFASIVIGTIVATVATPVFTIAFTPTPVPATTVYLVEAGPMCSQGVSFVGRSYFRVIAQVAAAGASPFDVLAAYTAKFGAPVTGAKIFVRLTPIDTLTFQKGTPAEAAIVVAA